MKNIKFRIQTFWNRFNEQWTQAAEMQKRIDEAKNQNKKYHPFHFPGDGF